MNKTVFKLMVVSAVLIACFGLPKADAVIPGLDGPNFTLVAKTGPIITGEGDAFQNWGYANDTGPMQYPGPTLIVNQGQLITVTLRNELTVKPTPMTPNVSIVFPGQVGVTATGGVTGLLTQEAEPGGAAVTYTFTASQPGTYMYHSGTSPELQIEMGLVGALIVRPTGYDASIPAQRKAYEHADSTYDHEYLFLETEMDDVIHRAVERGRWSQVDTTKWFPHLWFINGRNAPDTMAMAGVSWMPTQPYNCMPRMHPGEKLLLRIVAAGRDPHPLHTHGNNATIIARDGRLLGTPGGGADLGVSDFTFPVAPGGTIDAIFEWTGYKLGWDAYGHQADVDNPPLGDFPGPGDKDHNENGILDPLPPALPEEYAPDHGKPFPVVLPQQQKLTVGGMWSGSPFLGTMGALPPGEGGMNPNSGYTYMWHSHNEKEMTNNDIFPGGLMTMLIIEPPGVPIP